MLAPPWPLPRSCAAGKSRVTLVKDEQPVAGTDVLQILTHGGRAGETVTLEAVGPDAEAVLDALEPLFAGQFGDEAAEIRLIADAETSRDRRFAGRGHRRSAGDGQRGISHPSAVRRARCRRRRAGAARQGHRGRGGRNRPPPRHGVRRVGRKIRGDLRGPPANAAGLAAPQRAGGDDPPAALLARIRRQPHAAPLRPGLPAAGKPPTWRSGPTTSSTSRSGCCGTCWAAAAKGSPTSPRRCWCWPTTSRPARPPTSIAASSAASSPRSADRAAIRRSWPRPWKSPPWWAPGPFLTEVSGGDLVIIDGDKGLVILQPDEETLARYRHEAEEIRTPGRQARTAPRPAGRNPRRRPHPAAGQHRVPLRGRPLRRSRRRRRGPVPHRVPLPGRRDRAHRGGPLPGLFAAWSRRWATSRW